MYHLDSRFKIQNSTKKALLSVFNRLKICSSKIIHRRGQKENKSTNHSESN